MNTQMLEDADKNFAPKYMKFYDANGEEIQWEQVTKLNLVRQGDFIACQFFEKQKEAKRLQKQLKIWWILSAVALSVSVSLLIFAIVRLRV